MLTPVVRTLRFYLPLYTISSSLPICGYCPKSIERLNLTSSLDHIAHHLLTIYALGASPEIIQDQYDRNASYQRAPLPVDDKVVEDLHDSSKFSKYLQNERYYHDYLVFFQEEIDAKGYEEVINEYVLKGDERADDMLVRMYSGKLCLSLFGTGAWISSD